MGGFGLDIVEEGDREKAMAVGKKINTKAFYSRKGHVKYNIFEVRNNHGN